MATLINIDGKGINLDHVEDFRWENEKLILNMVTQHTKRIDTPNARRAYEYLCSLVPADATFTDSEGKCIDIKYGVTNGRRDGKDEYWILNLKTKQLGKRFTNEQAAWDYADLLNNLQTDDDVIVNNTSFPQPAPASKDTPRWVAEWVGNSHTRVRNELNGIMFGAWNDIETAQAEADRLNKEHGYPLAYGSEGQS